MTSPDAAAPRRAAFLDRDGTIIEDAHYLSRPDQVVLRPTAARAIQRLNEADVAVIVVTNQSGIARGMLTEADYQAVSARVTALLGERGARVDATYHCPHHPDVGGPCDCRKPGVALYEQAVREHALDGARSVFIGDRLRDVQPARHFKGYGILVPSPETSFTDMDRAGEEFAVSTTLEAAVERFLSR